MIDAQTAPWSSGGLGVLALAHGLTKILVSGPAGTVGFFQSLGYPAIAAYFAMAVETGGGLALILGFYPQVAALLQLPILLGAALGLASRLTVAAEGGRDGRRSTATSSEAPARPVLLHARVVTTQRTDRLAA
jgi:putative oxidoreductase